MKSEKGQHGHICHSGLALAGDLVLVFYSASLWIFTFLYLAKLTFDLFGRSFCFSTSQHQ